MQPRSPDGADYRFMAAPGAAVKVRLATDEQGHPGLEIFGNRAGLLSLANVLLWLVANAWRREFLALAELPFVQVETPVAVCLRLTDAEATGRDGLLSRTDLGEQFEWSIPEDDLRRVAMLVHRLASNPGHEYDRLLVAEGSAAGVHIRMLDAAEWLGVQQAEPISWPQCQ
jgi:hypothetical protein